MKQIFAKIELTGLTVYATSGNSGKYTIDSVEVDVWGGMDVSGISIVADPDAYMSTSTYTLLFPETYPVTTWRDIKASYILLNKYVTIMTERSGAISTSDPEIILKITGYGMQGETFSISLSSIQNSWLPGTLCRKVEQEIYGLGTCDPDSVGQYIAFGVGDFTTSNFPALTNPYGPITAYLTTTATGANQYLAMYTLDDLSASQGVNAVYDEEGNALTVSPWADPWLDAQLGLDVVRYFLESATFTKNRMYCFPKFTDWPLPNTLELVNRVIKFATGYDLIDSSTDANTNFTTQMDLRRFDISGASQFKFMRQDGSTVADFLRDVCEAVSAKWRINNLGMIEFVVPTWGTQTGKFHFVEADIVDYSGDEVDMQNVNNNCDNAFKWSPAHDKFITRKTYVTSSRLKSVETYGPISSGDIENKFSLSYDDNQVYRSDKFRSIEKVIPQISVRFTVRDEGIPDTIRLLPWDFVTLEYKNDLTAGTLDRLYWIKRIEPDPKNSVIHIDAIDCTIMNSVDPYLQILINPKGPKINNAIKNDAIINGYGLTNTGLTYDNTVSGRISSPLKVNVANDHILFNQNATLFDLIALDKMTWHKRVIMASTSANQNFIVWSSTSDYNDYITLRFLTTTKCLNFAFVQNGSAYYQKSTATNSINDTTEWHDIGVYCKKGTDLDPDAYEVHLLLDGTDYPGSFTPPQNINDGILTIGTRRTGASTYTASLAAHTVFEEVGLWSGGIPIPIVSSTYTIQTEQNTISGYDGEWPIV